ncbi:hypothetical protein IXO1221_20295, partial [Xanthomonas oryzae pv. oryzae]
MSAEPPLQAVHVIAHATGLVSRQTIKHQMDWTATAFHHSLEQVHEQFTVQAAAVHGEPEPALAV